MTLTRELLRNAASMRGDLNAQQLSLLGVTYPPPKGWMDDLIGKEIGVELWQSVMVLRYMPEHERLDLLRKLHGAKVTSPTHPTYPTSPSTSAAVHASASAPGNRVPAAQVPGTL